MRVGEKVGERVPTIWLTSAVVGLQTAHGKECELEGCQEGKVWARAPYISEVLDIAEG